MLRRALGPGAAAASVVGYGGMHLSIDGRPPDDQGVRVVQAALDAGATLIDTADVYCLDQHDIGHNERLIARALAGWRGPRAGVTVATKGGVVRPGGRWESDASPAHLRAAGGTAPSGRSASSASICISFTPPIRASPWPRAWVSWRGFGTRARSAGSASPT